MTQVTTQTGLLAELSTLLTSQALTVGQALQLIDIVNHNAQKLTSLANRVTELEAIKLPCKKVDEPTPLVSQLERLGLVSERVPFLGGYATVLSVPVRHMHH